MTSQKNEKENGRKELEIKDKELLFDAKAQKTWDDMAYMMQWRNINAANTIKT